MHLLQRLDDMAGTMRSWEATVYSETLGSSSVIGQVMGGSHALLGSSLSRYRSHSGRSRLRRHSWCSRRHRPDFVLCLPRPTLDFVDYAFRQRDRALGRYCLVINPDADYLEHSHGKKIFA